ncbi:MAG: Fe-S cluster assembly ATPase SufC [Patescibacteria group bacterium]
MSTLLQIKNLKVIAGAKKIINNLSLIIKAGETHVIMGPNGSGKSTLVQTIMGHHSYTLEHGSVWLNNKKINNLPPERRASAGLFLAFQNPQSLSGVPILSFLHLAYNNLNSKKINPDQLQKILKPILINLNLNSEFLARSVNDNFSGGEKKKLEVLQLLLFKPILAMLDETDSGLDLDALKSVAQGIKKLRDKTRGFLVITHYQRLLDYLKPDYVHIMIEGQIVASGGMELVKKIDKYGYNHFKS